MYLNNFSLEIPQGTERSGGYVELEHNRQYTLVLQNSRPIRCDARVEVDGKHVGTWRIERHNSITIERPARDTGRFTFYQLGTVEAAKVGLNQNDPNIGLVKVTFTPEREVQRPPTPPVYQEYESLSSQASERRSIPTPCAAPGQYSAGGTGLSGKSHQQFTTADEIVHDYSQQTVIHLRLVARSYNEPRPLTAYSTPVPPPVR